MKKKNNVNDQYDIHESRRILLLKKMMAVLHIQFVKVSELNYCSISRDLLLDNNTVLKLQGLKELLKLEYHSDMLTCLHENSLQKQKNPGICMVRQILKTHGLFLKPVSVFIGYDRRNGKKVTKRYFNILPE
jgi:hypothetical protein